MATQDNLKAAFAGESQANRKYLAFAKKADEEGFAADCEAFQGGRGGGDGARAQPSGCAGGHKKHD